MAWAPPWSVLLLTLLLGIQPVTTDLYLPALPTLQRDLGETCGHAADARRDHLPLASAQLIPAPLSDRFAAARCCWPASRIRRSPAWQRAGAQRWSCWWPGALQGGAGMAAGVRARSIVRDLFAHRTRARA